MRGFFRLLLNDYAGTADDFLFGLTSADSENVSISTLARLFERQPFKLTGEGRRVIFAAPNTGEMERLADIFTEYQVPFRMGSRNPAPGSETYLDETAYFTGDLTTTTIVRAPVASSASRWAARTGTSGSISGRTSEIRSRAHSSTSVET